MNNSASKLTANSVKKVILVTIGILALIGAIGYGTVFILKKAKAPTITSSSQVTPTKTNVSPAQAKNIADDAMTRAVTKATQGNQKDALADYQTAYDNYKAAGNTHDANDAQFAISSIKAALAAPQNPGKPTGGKTTAAAKQ
jgi:hypothetical protein